MESLVPILINLAGGAIGGNLAGAILKNLSLGTLGNTIAGLIGGGVVSQVAPDLLGTAGGPDAIMGLIAQIAGSGAGGGLTMIIIGIIKKMMSN